MAKLEHPVGQDQVNSTLTPWLKRLSTQLRIFAKKLFPKTQHMLLQFFLPYLALCHLASWGLAQNLEGLGLFKYLNTVPMQVGDAIVYPMNLNPRMGVVNLALILTYVLVVVFLLNIRACFYLNRWVGGTGLILWSLPGVLSLLGCMPNLRGVGPDLFLFGEGFPGSVESAASNLLICLVGGWSLILLFSSFWKKNTFKNAYDHVWYTLGLIAALYFVVDSGLSSYKKDLADADERMVHTLELFRAAEKRLEALCALPDSVGLSPALCAQAPELKWGINSYLDMKGNLRAKVEPPVWAARLARDPVLAREIEALNKWACAQGQQPAYCQKISIDIALSVQDVDTPQAFPPPNYAEAIQRLFSSMEKSDRRIHDIERGHNLRYFGFLLVAILAGGKLANASRAMVKDDSVCPPSWVLTVIKHVCKKAMVLLKRLASLSALTYRYLARLSVALLSSCEKAREASRDQ